MDQARNDEIDLLNVLETIWKDKWKIVIFILISLTFGIAYILYTPNVFKATTIVQKSNQSLYFKYKYLNDILMLETDVNSEYFNSGSSNINNVNLDFEVFKVDANRIFKMFVNEFQDYEEMMTILSKNEYVKDKIKNLSTKEKRKSLIQFAKKFTISKPRNTNDNWKISFHWHEINEGTSILNSALELTLLNVQKTLSKEINNIAKSIDYKNQLKTTSLNIELQNMREITKLINAKDLTYLMEQSNIAKELNIEKNILNTNNFNISNISGENPKYMTFIHENTPFPYFLRGYKAINKEIELIKNRSQLDKDLLTKGYIKIQQKIINIQNDHRSKTLREAKKTIDNEDVAKWVNYNLELAEIHNLKRSRLYIFISIIIGAIFGTAYILFSQSFRQKKNKEKQLV